MPEVKPSTSQEMDSVDDDNLAGKTHPVKIVFVLNENSPCMIETAFSNFFPMFTKTIVALFSPYTVSKRVEQ